MAQQFYVRLPHAYWATRLVSVTSRNKLRAWEVNKQYNGPTPGRAKRTVPVKATVSKEGSSPELLREA